MHICMIVEQSHIHTRIQYSRRNTRIPMRWSHLSRRMTVPPAQGVSPQPCPRHRGHQSPSAVWNLFNGQDIISKSDMPSLETKVWRIQVLVLQMPVYRPDIRHGGHVVLHAQESATRFWNIGCPLRSRKDIDQQGQSAARRMRGVVHDFLVLFM